MRIQKDLIKIKLQSRVQFVAKGEITSNTLNTTHKNIIATAKDKDDTMAPTESKILSNYLLVPAQLPAIISLQEFIALFPRSMQSSSQIRSLYRDLQSQRNALVDAVAADIETETKRGRAQRRAFIKEKRNAESQEYDDEVEIERMVR